MGQQLRSTCKLLVRVLVVLDQEIKGFEVEADKLKC